jgi:hypothetical protein
MDSGDDDHHHHLCGCDPACACCSDRFSSWLLSANPSICGGAEAAVSSHQVQHLTEHHVAPASTTVIGIHHRERRQMLQLTSQTFSNAAPTGGFTAVLQPSSCARLLVSIRA